VPFTFTQDQLAQIDALAQQAEAGEIQFADVYEFVANLIEPSDDPDVESAERWLRGAVQANAGQGFYSDIIREYTQVQGELRLGSRFSASLLQEASDNVALGVIADILGSGVMPSVEEIAENDATAVGDTLIRPVLDPLDSAVLENAAWSGAVLFSALQQSPAQTNSLLNGGTFGVADAFDDLKNVLFAYVAYSKAFEFARSKALSLDTSPVQVWRDASITVDALWDELFGNVTVGVNPLSGSANVIGLTQGSELEPLFRLFRAYGPNRILNAIQSSYAGTISVLGDDPNLFDSAAHSFFASLAPALQQATSVELLDGFNRDQLASLAATSESYRNALAALSVVAVELSSFDGRNLDLYDRAPGQGNITEQWLKDRSSMLVVKQLFDNNQHNYSDVLNAISFPIPGNLLFRDRGSSMELAVNGIDFGVLPQRLFDFGSSQGEVIDGGEGSDSLFGAGGVDTINGMQGNDYVEGGGDGDTLSGGQGNDVLIGGEGDDTLEAGAGTNDRVEGGAGNDTYVFNAGDEHVAIFDADSIGTVEIHGHQPTPYSLGERTIEAVSGESTLYADDLGTGYELLPSGVLRISFSNGDRIEIENFASGDLGITLGPEESFDVPTSQPGSRIFNVDPVAQPQPEEVHGRYSSIGGVPVWTSYGAILNDTVPEVINADSLGPISDPDVFFRVEAGPGDSIMNGDGGFNFFVDDAVTSAGQLGVIYGNDVLNGGDGVDWLSSSFGDDWLFGGDDDSPDLLVDNPDPVWGGTQWVSESGNSSNDHLFGGGGDDYQISNGGDDYSDGGTGNDEIYAGAGNDTLIGGSGDDILSGDTRLTQDPVIVSGEPGSIMFTFNGNFIDGEQTDYGSDTLIGGTGADALYGGGGSDTLSGGDDNDYLQGDFMLARAGSRQGLLDHMADAGAIHGDDNISAGAGDDIAYGGGGADVIHGDAGDDFLYGDWDEANSGYSLDSQFHGDDYLTGGVGSDVVYGNGGNDILEGNEDNDFLFGGAGDDVMSGGSGADQLVGDEGRDILDGGDDSDTLFGGAGDDDLFGGAGDDALVGGEGNDLLWGDEGDDTLFGEAGDDVLVGGEGQDSLAGGDGNDILFADTGNDQLFGEAGEDTYVVSAGAGTVQIVDTDDVNTLVFGHGVTADDVSVAAANGLVFIDFGPGDSIATDTSTFASFESVEFADGSTLSRAELYAAFEPGNAFSFTLGGGASVNDLSVSSVGNDLVLEYDGPVVDWVDAEHLAASNILFRQGTASEFGLPGNQPVLVLANWFNVEPGEYVRNVFDSSGGSLFLPLQNEIQRTFHGTAGADIFMGGDEADALAGGAGADVLEGGEGNDDYSPGADTDLIIDPSGNDVYRVDLQGGLDFIIDSSGTSDRLLFGADITPVDIVITEDIAGLRITLGDPGDGNQITISDWANDANAIEFFEFSDGTIWDLATIKANITGNRSPIINQPFANVRPHVGEPFSLTIPSNAFSDPNGDALEVTVSGAGGSLLPTWLNYDSQTQTLSGTPGTSDFGEFVLDVTARDPDGLTVSTPLALELASLFEGTDNNDTIFGDANPNDIFGYGGDDRLDGRGGNNLVDGGDGDDTITAGGFGFGDNILVGGAGNDTLTGGSGNDTLIGGPGDDSLTPSFGDDLIRIASGDGSDFLRFTNAGIDNGSDVIEFDIGIDPADVISSASVEVSETTGGYVLRLPYNPGDLNDRLDVHLTTNEIEFAGEVGSVRRELMQNVTLRFAGGQSFPLADIFDLVNSGTENDDVLFATNDNAIVSGLGGNDRLHGLLGLAGELYGGEGADTLLSNSSENYILDGGAGNDNISGDRGNDSLIGGGGDDSLAGNRGDDSLAGGAGDDIYRIPFVQDFGHDVVTDNSGLNRIIADARFAGWQLNEFTFSQSGDDLLISSNFTSFPASMTVVNWFAFPANRMDAFVIDDGFETETYTATQIEGLAFGINTAPIVNIPLADFSQIEGQFFGMTYSSRSFLDTNPEPLAYSYQLANGNPLPSWINFNTETPQLFGTAGPAGVYNIEITAIDIFGLTVTDQLTLTISGSGANTAPILDNPISDAIAAEDSALSIVIPANTFSDGDVGDSISYTAELSNGESLPEWLDFDPATQTFTGTPPNNSNGSIDIEVVATDTGGLSASDTFTLNIADTNFAPVLDNLIADAMGTEGQVLNVTIAPEVFSDPDLGDTLTLSAQLAGGGALPAWLTFDSAMAAFSGTPPVGSAGILDIEVTATDSGGLSVSDEFAIDISDGANVIIGTPGNDVLEGTTAVDHIYGREGDDVLRGYEGADLLVGESGDDTLIGGDGNDQLDGGDGNDDIRANAGDDTVFAGAGDDVVIGQGGADMIRGEAGADDLDGGGGADMIFGDDGNDTITGGPGGDDLYGGLNDDLIFGGLGNDDLHGGEGEDTLNGEDGRDFLYGDAGMDTLSGGVGDDVIEGGLGDDILMGGADNDVLRGDAGADTLHGESGDDILIGGDGADVLYGGDGVDDIRGNAGDDTIFAGDGDDVVIGQGGADTIDGEAGADNIDGGGGADMIFGGAGNDTIAGGAGADDLFGGLDDDMLFGGLGNDELHGDAGNDSLTGEDGRDFLYGEDGVDNLAGGAGDDVLEGGLGDDTLLGGIGDDVVRGDEGDDTLFGDSGADILIGGDGDDIIDGGDGADDIRANGGNDSVFAGVGDDTVIGQGGADTIRGEAGDDYLDGGGGADTIFGGSGADTIIGGLGSDTLSGNDGADLYQYNFDDGNDTINNASADIETDRLLIGSGATTDQLILERVGDDLTIAFTSTTGSVRVQGWFVDTVQEIDFIETEGDGVVLTAADINALFSSQNAASSSAPNSFNLLDIDANGTLAEPGPINQIMPSSWPKIGQSEGPRFRADLVTPRLKRNRQFGSGPKFWELDKSGRGTESMRRAGLTQTTNMRHATAWGEGAGVSYGTASGYGPPGKQIDLLGSAPKLALSDEPTLDIPLDATMEFESFKRADPRGSGPKFAPAGESVCGFSTSTFLDFSLWSLGDSIRLKEHGLQNVEWTKGDELDRLASQFVSQIGSVRDAGKFGVGGFGERERFADESPRLIVPSSLRYEP
jgi:Ca2+-binding RTX toxin-like protein